MICAVCIRNVVLVRSSALGMLLGSSALGMMCW